MTEINEFQELADRNIEHACKLVLKLLNARGCDDPEATLAVALLDAMAQRVSDLERIGTVEYDEPANDCPPSACGCREFGEDLLD